MLSTKTTTEPAEDAQRCDRCQHRVDVPGIGQIVCLAHLAVFATSCDVACAEFEPKTPGLCPQLKRDKGQA